MLLIPSEAVSIWGLGDARLAQKTQMTKMVNRFLGTEDILPVLVIDQLKWKTTPYTSSIAIAMVFWPYPPQRNSKLALVSPFSVLCLYSFHPHPYLGQIHELPKWFVWVWPKLASEWEKFALGCRIVSPVAIFWLKSGSHRKVATILILLWSVKHGTRVTMLGQAFGFNSK